MNNRTIQILSLALFALLLLWGGYTFILYIGVPAHGAALLSDATFSGLSCDAKNYLCRGVVTFLPFLWHTITRASPFLGYGIGWLIVAAVVIGWQWWVEGRTTLRIAWTPWKILLCFVFSVWLFSTVLSLGTANGRDVRLFVEPTKDTYNVNEDTLAVLTQDYQKQLADGCLAPLGQTESGAHLYTFRLWCVEKAFVTRVMTQMIFILFLLFDLLVIGRAGLDLLQIRAKRVLTESAFSVALGAGACIVILWVLAITGIYTQTVGWLLLLAIPLICFPHARYWLKTFLTHTCEREYRWTDLSVIVGWLLLSYIALNFLEVIRPFPIGWDDLGSYLNRPRLLVSYGYFIPSMSPFDWTYLTSLGFMLFGYNSIFGSTAAMLINWSEGPLAILAIIAFGNTFLGKGRGVLAALLYYTLPLVGHFSYADMKIDNAVFMFGTVGVLAVLSALLPDAEHTPVIEEDPPTAVPPSLHRHIFSSLYAAGGGSAVLPRIALGGLFCGFAFATKSTAIMIFLPLVGMILGIELGAWAFISMIFATFFLFTWQQVFSISDTLARVGAQLSGKTADSLFAIACVVAALLCGSVALFRHRKSAVRSVVLIIALAIGFFAAVAPWVAHNNMEEELIFSRFELSAKDHFKHPDIFGLPPELEVNREDPTCKPSGATEELDRYWGYGKSWSHYFTLPWRTVMNIDSVGYYVTTGPMLLLFPLLLLLPYFWKREGRWLRWLFLGTLLMVLEWMFLANGIPWYGIGIFLGLVLGLETLVMQAPDRPNRIVAAVLIGFSLLTAFDMRFWQFEEQRNIFEYSMGKISSDALRAVTIPYYDGISATVVQRHNDMPSQPYLYRIGTFIPYFIPRNLEIIGLNDHQLDTFNCLYQERDPALTTKRLKAIGFNSIIFDTNTATIEQNQSGSLHKKVDAFVEYVNNPASGLQVVISDTNAGVAFIEIP